MATVICPLPEFFPVSCPDGNGYALAYLDYGQENYLHLVIALDADGAIVIHPNKVVKLRHNVSMGRPPGVDRCIPKGDADGKS